MPVGFKSRSAVDTLDLCCCSNNSQGFCEACCDATKSQTSVCSNEKVSQMPSGGWSYFDSRPTAHPLASDTDGQHIWPDCLWLKLHPSIIFLIYSQSCFDKTDGVPVEQIMPHFIMREGQRSVEVYLGHCHNKLINLRLTKA